MIGSENENELALDNVAGIRNRSQFWGGPKSGSRAEEWRKNGVGNTSTSTSTIRADDVRWSHWSGGGWRTGGRTVIGSTSMSTSTSTIRADGVRWSHWSGGGRESGRRAEDAETRCGRGHRQFLAGAATGDRVTRSSGRRRLRGAACGALSESLGGNASPLCKATSARMARHVGREDSSVAWTSQSRALPS